MRHSRRRTGALITNDPNVSQTYKGVEITMNEAAVEPLADVGRLYLRENRIDNVSVDVSPNYLINANGNITPDAAVSGSSRCAGCSAANSDRPNQFKLTGMYIAPWHDVIISGNLQPAAGPCNDASDQPRRSGFATNQIINLEPLGTTRIDPLTKIDLRLGKLFTFAAAGRRRRRWISTT